MTHRATQPLAVFRAVCKGAFGAKLKDSKIRVDGKREKRYRVHFTECPPAGADRSESGNSEGGGTTDTQTDGNDAPTLTLEVLAKESDMPAAV